MKVYIIGGDGTQKGANAIHQVHKSLEEETYALVLLALTY